MAAKSSMEDVDRKLDGECNEIGLYAELRSHVSVFNLTVGFDKRIPRDLRVSAEEDKITVESDDNQCTFSFENVELLPSTCRGLQWRRTEELQLTLQVKEGKDSTCRDQYGRACRKQEALCSRITASQHHCYCSCCGKKVLKDNSIFLRVLPLPSENWSDLAEFWFCHRHGDEDHSIPSMKQRLRDCLVGNLHILVSWSSVQTRSVNVHQESNLITCTRCGHILGVKVKAEKENCKNGEAVRDTEEDSCHLYLHAVDFRDTAAFDTQSNIWGSYGNRVECFLSELLQEQSRLYTCFRFLVESQSSKPSKSDQSQPSNNKVKLLLWLIDQDLTLFQTKGKFGQSKVKVASNKVVKVLYRCLIGAASERSASSRCDSYLFKTWERDNSVHGLTLPRPLCLQLVSTLVNNTNRLPLSARHLNGFHVGYLHREETT